MGIDLWQESKACETCGHKNERETFSYTYNVSAMWYAIFPQDKKMVDIDGMNGKEAAKKIIKALKFMELNKEKMILPNPSNGFGSFDGFYNFLIKLYVHSMDNPTLIWRSWR